MIKNNRNQNNHLLFALAALQAIPLSIFAQNAGTGGDMRLKTTQQAFVDKLHTYTIVDAINDENVLPFRIDYVNTIKEKEGILDQQISAIDREKAMASPERVSQIVKYIIDHFDQKTKRSS